jgi:uncharacterized protein YdbL (DUF1318 family)
VRRLFWVALGASAGVVVVRRLTRVANSWTPEGLAARAGGVGERLSGFLAEVSAAAAEREAELRQALGVDGEPG